MHLHEAIAAFREVEALVESSRQTKKIRAPNLQHALGWGARERTRLTAPPGLSGWDKWEYEKEARLDPPEPQPDWFAVKDAEDREIKGPNKSVQDFLARKAKEKAAVAAEKRAEVRQAAKERKAASRERRLKAQGLPMDYSKKAK